MRKVFIGSFVLLFILVGCNQKEDSRWYDTKEQAIEAGFKQEGIDESAILSIEEYEGETIVFLENDGAFGLANLNESKKGYSWSRQEPYADFDVEGDLPYTTNTLDFKTQEGTKGSVLYGKVFDSSIQKMKLIGDGADRELEVSEETGLFYTIHQQPITSLEVVPIKE